MHFDVDNSGYITADNLKEAMARGGRKLPDEEIKNMIKEVVKCKKVEKIKFQDFYDLMHPDVSKSANDTFLSQTDSLTDL